MNQTDGQSLSGAYAGPRLGSDSSAQASAPSLAGLGPLTSDRVCAFECHSHHGISMLQGGPDTCGRSAKASWLPAVVWPDARS